MKKLISILLSIAMTITLMPSVAFAGINDGGKLVKAGEYTLNVVNDSQAPGIYAVTINGKSYKVTIPGTDKTPVQAQVPQALNGTVNGTTLTVQMDKDDTYSVQLLSRPEYYAVDPESVNESYQADNENPIAADDSTYTAGQGKSEIKKGQFVTILRDKSGEKLIKDKSVYTGTGNELKAEDEGKTYVQIDNDEIAKLVDCKLIASENSSKNWPTAWASYDSGKYYFNPLDTEMWIGYKSGSATALVNTFFKYQYNNTSTLSNFAYASAGTIKAIKVDNVAVQTAARSLGNVGTGNVYTNLEKDVKKYVQELQASLGDDTKRTVEFSVSKAASSDVYGTNSKPGTFNTHGVYIYQLVEKADIKTELPAAKVVTYTFSADAKKKMQDAAVKVLNQERFDGLTKALNSDALAQVVKDIDELKKISIESLASITALLQKAYVESIGALAKSDNIPMGSEATLKEVDLKDGFFEGLEYDLDQAEPEFLNLDANYLTDQLIPGTTLQDLLNTAKIILNFIGEGAEEAERIIYLIEKNLPTGNLNIPIAIGTRYSSNEKIREGVYELEITNPGNGWMLDTNKLFVRVNPDGSLSQVTIKDGVIKEVEDSFINTKKAIGLDVTALIKATNSATMAGFADSLGALFEDGLAYASKETGLWVSHQQAKVEFDVSKFGLAEPGAEYALINEDQLRALVSAIVDGGSLERVNVPTILKGVADSKGVVTFTEDSDVSIETLTKAASAIYDAGTKTAGTLTKVYNKAKSVATKVKSTIQKILGISPLMKNSKEANVLEAQPQAKAPVLVAASNASLLSEAPAKVTASNDASKNEALAVLSQVGDPALVKGIEDFMDWLNTIKSPELKLDKASGTVYSNQSGSTSFKVSEKDFHSDKYTFEWDNGSAPSGITAAVVRNDANTIKVTVSSNGAGTSAINGTYGFTVKGSYDGLDLSLKGKIVVATYSSTPSTPSTPEEPEEPEDKVPVIEQVMSIVKAFGNNSLGYTALNLVGLKDGTLPEGNYVLIQTSAPAGHQIVKGTYKVSLAWNADAGEYDVTIKEGKLAKLSQKSNKRVYTVKKAAQAVKKTAKTIATLGELIYLINH